MYHKRLQRIEKALESASHISQEQRTCRYLQLCQDPEAPLQEKEAAFEHVQHVLPNMHGWLHESMRGRYDA